VGIFSPFQALPSPVEETWLPAHQLIRSLLFTTGHAAGCSVPGFVLALCLPCPGRAMEQTGGRPLASPQPAPGVPGVGGITDSFCRDAICSARRRAARSRGRARGRGACRRRARGVFWPAVLPLAPRFPGRGQPAEPASGRWCFARLVISHSFSQHKKCNCAVPPTRHSSSPTRADSFPVTCLLQHFVFTFCGFPFQPWEQFTAALRSLVANPRVPVGFGSQSSGCCIGFGFKVREVADL